MSFSIAVIALTIPHVPPVAAGNCNLYPVGISAPSLAGKSPGEILHNVPNGTAPGHFGWLTWGGSPDTPTLVTSLTAPGDSHAYVNPDDPADHQISVGDWISAKPGVSNSQTVREALERLKNITVTVPVWDAARGQGEKAAYRVAAFASIQLLDYQLPRENRITVRFLGFVACDDQNVAPLVEAGPDQKIFLTETATLAGTVSDDGLPAGGTLTVLWAQISGPGAVTFTDPAAAITSATFTQPGVYVLRLSASDGELAGHDEVTITVDLLNRPPAAHDQAVTLNEDEAVTITLAGSDPDGDPLTFAIVTPPSQGTLSGTPPNVVYSPAPDFYGLDMFTFAASDGELVSPVATVFVVVHPVNDAPVVHAGENLTITLPAAAWLDGSVTDDGTPAGAGLSVGWGKVSGPGLVIFGNWNQAITTARFSAPGLYVLRLTATDSELIASDDVTVIVNSAEGNQPPFVSAGENLVIGLNDTTRLNGTVTDDNLPAGSSVVAIWSVVSGAGSVSFANPGAPVTAATFGASGVYVLRLSATDGELSAFDDVQVTVYLGNQPPVVAVGPDRVIVLPNATVPAVDFEPLPAIAVSETWQYDIGRPGLNAAPYGLAVRDGIVFAGGAFKNAGGTATGTIAQWQCGTWTSLDDPRFPGFEAPPHTWAVAEWKGDVFAVGGFFRDLNIPPDGHGDLAGRWDGQYWNAWNFKNLLPWLGARALRTTPDAVYMGGWFLGQPAPFSVGHEPLPDVSVTSSILGWDGEQWFNLGEGIRHLRPDGVVEPGDVLAIAVGPDGAVYAAGQFNLPTPAGEANHIAKWNGSDWEPLGSGMSGCAGFNCLTSVEALEFGPDGYLYAGGNFTFAGGMPADFIARWDGQQWSPVGGGVNSIVSAMVLHGPDLYVGGRFTLAGGQAANRIAKWNGATWNTLGQGTTNGVNNNVIALAATPSGVYLGGWFNAAGGQPANSIVKWGTADPPVLTAPENTIVSINSPFGASATVFAHAHHPCGKTFQVSWQINHGPILQSTIVPVGAGETAIPFAHTFTPGVHTVTITADDDLAPPVRRSFTVTVAPLIYADLNATVTDDGLPSGGTIAHHWTMISGPAAVSFEDSTAAATRATFAATGVYVLRFTATDSELTGDDELTITVAENQPPAVSAGPDRTLALSETLFLDGSASDDGLPPGSTLSMNWAKVSGPGTVIFTGPNAVSTAAEFSAAGEYVLRFTASDSQITRGDEVRVLVEPDCQSAGSGLVAWWRGDGDPLDAVSGHTAVLLNGATFGNGRFGQGFQFDGVDDHVRVAAAPQLNIGAGSGITIEAWINPTDLASRPLVEWRSTTGTFGAHFWSSVNSPGSLFANLLDTTGASHAISSSAGFLTAGSLQHVAVTYEKATGLARLYHNGQIIAAQNLGIFTPQTSFHLNLGRRLPNLTFRGKLDELALYNRALSPSEIEVLATADNPGKCVPAPGPCRDAVAEFSLAANPNGDWSYGAQPQPGGTFTLSPTAASDINVELWQPSGGPFATYPLVARNKTSSILTLFGIFQLAPDVLLLHPSNNGQYSVVRWTAPAAGLYRVRGFFEGLDNPTTDVHVLHNNSSAFSDFISGRGTLKHFHVVRQIGLGDTVDFSVGWGNGNYNNDSTGLRVCLEPLSELTSNRSPLADAGPDRAVILPGMVTLNGLVSDDGLPAGSVLAIQWSQIAGPAPATFNPGTLSPAVQFSVAGTYHFRLTASDGELASADDVVVRAYPSGTANTAPTVWAGPDLTVATGQSALLFGEVEDDGLPGSGSLTVAWTKLSGPGTVSFGNFAAAQTSATFSADGTYVLRLTANDSALSAFDDVTVTVVPNQRPNVSAGPGLTVNQLESATLNGAASDDGLPVPLTVFWSQVSGPGTATFASSSSANTTVSFSAPGHYVLRLTADDSLWLATDDVIVTVQPSPNQPPVVDAGPDRALNLPGILRLTGTVTDDGLPNGTLIRNWTQITGPGAVSFSIVNGVYYASFSEPGAYVLRLTASDTELSAFDELTVTAFDQMPAPLVEIHTPIDSQSITAPTEVIGTIQSPILQSWLLEYRPSGSLNSQLPNAQPSPVGWTTLASGATSITAAPLATLDPTLSLNGIYELRLTATDLANQTAATEPVAVIFDRNLKIGPFTISFNDLTIPVAGLPLTIARSYNSRDKSVGDFGVGWKLELANIRVQKNRNLGRNWQQTSSGGMFPFYSLQTTRPRLVGLTFPDGKVHRFGVVPAPATMFALPIGYAQMEFVPLPGTHGTLTPVFLHHQTGEVIVDDWAAFPPPVPGFADLISYELVIDPPPGSADNILWNPAMFEFTTETGYRYLVSETNGLHRITDPNGNTLTITSDGLLHSSGKNVLFERDELGRITNIVDAAGHATTYTYDANGNLAGFTDRDGDLTTYTYDGAHNLLTVTNPEGVTGLTNEYDADGRLIRNVGASGQAIGYRHDIAGRRQYTTNQLGHVTVEEFDDNGNVVKMIDPLGAVTLSTYDEFDNLLSRTDPLGRTSTYTYDAEGNRTSETNPLGQTVQWSYDHFGNVLAYTDAEGNETAHTYDANGNLASVRDALGNVTQFSYDGRGKVTSRTDSFGHVTTFEYDQFGNLTREMDALGNATSYAVDDNGRLLGISRIRTVGETVSLQGASTGKSRGPSLQSLPSNRSLQTQSLSLMSGPTPQPIIISLTYTPSGQPHISLYPDGGSLRQAYDRAGRIAHKVDPEGRVTTYHYDAAGQLTGIADADGNEIQYAYDAAGRLIKVTDPLDRETTFIYDAAGHVRGVMYPDGTKIGAAYNLAGELIRETNRLGQVTTYAYDAAGNRISATDHLGLTTTFTYNSRGGATSMTDRLGRTTTFEFDALNRNTQIRHPDGTTQSFTYAGRLLTSATDEAGQLTRFGYDGVGRLTSITNRLGEVTRLVYDEVGNRIAEIDPLNQITRHEYDNVGRPIRTILPDQGTIQRQFDRTGRLLSVTDQNGQTTSAQYDGIGRLATVTDPLSRTTQFSFDGAGQLTSFVDAGGRIHRFEYNAAGQRTARIYPDGTREAIQYDAFGRPKAFLDQAGNSTQLAYDARSRIRTVMAPDGQATSYGYDVEDQLTSITDAAGRTTEFAYNLRGRRTHVFHPDGTSTITGYDVLGRPITQTDRMGNSRHFAYDAKGRVTSVRDALNQPTHFNYDAAGRVTSILDALNRTTSFSYDSVGRLTGAVRPDGTASSRQYDPRGLLLADTDPNGNTTRYAYDALGQLVAVTNALGQVTQFSYDTLGRLTALTDAANRTTTYGYDMLGRRTSIALADGAVFGSTYDARGLRISSADALGNMSFYGYDVAGRLTSATNALGHVTAYAYDPVGRLLSVTDANQQSTGFDYDAMGRLTTITFADNTTRQFFYDANGRQLAETDQAGQSTWFGYDEEGRLTSVTNALAQVTRYEYDALGRLISETDANTNTTVHAYDALGRRVRRTLPGGEFEQFGYDANGNLTARTDFNGFVTTYGYDALNRLLQRVPDPTLAQPPITYTYTATGARASMTDASGSTSYAYDLVDRLLEKSVTWNSAPAPFTASLRYTYDRNGNLLSTRSSNLNGADVAYEYDSLNRLAAVNDTRLGRTSYSYDPAGNLTDCVYPNQLNQQFAYDALNRLTNVTVLNGQAQAVQSFAYALGAAGHRLGVMEASGRTTSYDYDPLYRLTRETMSLNAQLSTIDYTYDAVGNRLARFSTLNELPSTSHAYSANNRLLSDTYDANGNTVAGRVSPSASLASDRYDFEDRLIERSTTLNSQPTTLHFLYDGDGNRVAKTAGGVTTRYLVDDLNPTGSTQVLEELATFNSQPSTPAVTRVYTHGYRPISQDQVLPGGGSPQWQASFYGYDGLGSVRFLSDLNGQPTDAYAYDAFGNLISQAAIVPSPTPNSHLFRGEQFDSDLGLYYLRARYANPDSGRFWTADSFEGFLNEPASRHAYTFNYNDPVNRIDPSGHYSLGEGVAVASLAPMVRGMVDNLMASVSYFGHGLAGGEELKAISEEEALFIDSLAQGAGVNLGRNNFYQTRMGAPFLLNWNQPYAQYPAPCGTFSIVSSGGDFRLYGCAAKHPVFEFGPSELYDFVSRPSNFVSSPYDFAVGLGRSTRDTAVEFARLAYNLDGSIRGLALSTFNPVLAYDLYGQQMDEMLMLGDGAKMAVQAASGTVGWYAYSLIDEEAAADAFLSDIEMFEVLATEATGGAGISNSERGGYLSLGGIFSVAGRGTKVLRAANSAPLDAREVQALNRAITLRADPPNIRPPLKPRSKRLQEPDSLERHGPEQCPKAKRVEEGRAAQNTFNEPSPSIPESATQLEFGFVPAVERQTLARDFYRATTGWSDSRIASHLRGIDLNQAVSVVNLPAGTSLAQYQLPSGRIGNYFAAPGTPADQLGIYTSGLVPNSYVLPRPVQALKSTAAAVVDDWSMNGFGWRIQTQGGGQQFFVPNGASAVSP